MLFPWTDWQFWLVTAIAVGGAWMVFRQLLPREESSTVCGACAAGTAACAKHAAAERKSEPQLVVLTPRRRSEGSHRTGAGLGDQRPAGASVEDRGQRLLET